jgi:hypothetical protein
VGLSVFAELDFGGVSRPMNGGDSFQWFFQVVFVKNDRIHGGLLSCGTDRRLEVCFENSLQYEWAPHSRQHRAGLRPM